MNVHVTGGTGFLGPFVIRRLVERGHVVTALARSESSARIAENLGAKPLYGDLNRPDSIQEAFELAAPEVLVNVASLGFGHASAIIAAAESSGIRRAIFVSTTSIFTGLNAPSKATRVAAEENIRMSGLEWTIVRPTMIYGAPGDRNMERLLRAIKRWRLLPLPGGGKGLQQPVHVQDLAVAIAAAAESPDTAGKSYDLAGPSPMTLRSVCEEAAAAVGKRVRLLVVPLHPLISAVRLLERAGVPARITSEQLKRLAEDKAFDVSPARSDLEFRPRAFAEGIRQEVEQLA